ncbi:MAG: SDR family NAD(P)-dependent oxidoreductase [Acutalibacteraceae bacterium]
MSKVTVLTSGTSGIGKAIALKILKESDCDEDLLIINYGHNDEAANKMRDELCESDRKKVIFIKADMSEYDGMTEFASKVLQVTDKIDWLILNTGIGTYEKFDNYTVELWNKVINTNLTIPTFLIKTLKDNISDGGKILFMGSYSGEVPYTSSIVYGVSKAAVHYLAKALLKVFDYKSVSINAIAPGFVETPWQANRSEESYERINKKIALHRFATADEVAKLSYDVLTNDYINGSVIDIHGGYDYF